MVCDAWVVKHITPTGKNIFHLACIGHTRSHDGKIIPYTAIEVMGMDRKRTHIRNDEECDTLQRCGGDIEAMIDSYNEPEWGGSYAVTRITYRCKKCRNGFYPILPRDNNELEMALMEYIRGLDDL